MRPLEEPSITRDNMMKFFFLKSVILMITFVNYYLLRFIMDQANAFHDRFYCLMVVVIVVDVLILYFTVRKNYGNAE